MREERPGLVLACACVCTLVVMGLVAAVNLAVPMMAAGVLRPTAAQLLWIVDSYVVVFACLVIPGGAVGDRFGRKGVLITGLLVFAAGALGCAAASTVPVMLAARAVTGVGAALVLPNCVGVLVHSSPPEVRPRVLATWGAVSGLGGVVGNLLGGAVLTTGSWRSLFLAVVPVAVLSAVWAARVVPASARSARSLDPIGTALLVAATTALLLGIIEGPEHGWRSGLVVVAFVATAVLGVSWVVAELRVAHPVLDPRLFRIPSLRSASLGMLVTFFGSFGLFYLNASLLQYARGFTVLEAGVGIMPLAVPLLVLSRFVPRLVGRAGLSALLPVAFGCIAAGLGGLSWTLDRSYLAYAAALFVVGVGFALALPCLSAELTAALPAEQAGIGGGLQAATRELGSALGVAVVGTVLAARFAAGLPASLQQHHPVPHTVAQALAAAPVQHHAVLAAFDAGAASALRVAAVITVVAGALVVAGARRSAHQRRDRVRRTERRREGQQAQQREHSSSR